MGWNDSHLHAFQFGDRIYGPDDDDPPEGQVDETTVSLLEALDDAEAEEFVYDYDFGDGWSHWIRVEGRATQDVAMTLAVCTGGARACPPDDVGGPGGYEEFLVAIGDPGHEDHEDFLEWVGGSFDPSAFDVGAVNALLQKLR